MKQGFLIGGLGILLAGCALLDRAGLQGLQPKPAPTPVIAQTHPQARTESAASAARNTVPVPEAARTVEEFDTTTADERSAAAATQGEDRLGVTIASLGAPSEPGFWLKTPLVKTAAKGRVVYPGTGKSAGVDLIPIEGPETAGSRLSLAAMRLIGAPLTGLPEIEVYRSDS